MHIQWLATSRFVLVLTVIPIYCAYRLGAIIRCLEQEFCFCGASFLDFFESVAQILVQKLRSELELYEVLYDSVKFYTVILVMYSSVSRM